MFSRLPVLALLVSLSLHLGPAAAASIAAPAHPFRTPSAASPSAASTANVDAQARAILAKYPLIDSHVDLPFVMRHLAQRPLDIVSEIGTGLPGHVDIPRLRAGDVAGVFNIAYAPCDASAGSDFLTPTNSAEYAFESIDLIHRVVEQHPEDLALALTAADLRRNFAEGKISSFIGLEGSHHLMNSLSILRMFAQLGVRYLTLTHTCHNSFASSAGDGSPIAPAHSVNGLTGFGKELVPELNRLGVMVDLSHVSDQTMHDALDLSLSPVLFSHSGARAVYDHPRNVPDDVLRRIGSGPGQNPGVVSVIFYPSFVDPQRPTVARVADHIDYIALVCGYAHVGLGSDFDGIYESVKGLEDASKFPNLIVELLHRGWSEVQLEGLIGGNLLRVMEASEVVKDELAAERASPAVYEKRRDMPVEWAGPQGEYLPQDVKRAAQALHRSNSHEEL